MEFHLRNALMNIDSKLFSRLDQEITEAKIYGYLKPLADTYAPSQSVPFTRAKVLKTLLENDNVLDHPNVKFDRNYMNTGNAVLLLGQKDRQKKVWLLAHLDIISYLIEPPINGRYPLLPLCYHMMHPGSLPGVAVGYNIDKLDYEVICKGKIQTDIDGKIFFSPYDSTQLLAGNRVCFESKMLWNRKTGELSGSIDDVAGVAALVMATKFLADYNVELMLGLTDEEEGVSGDSNQTICRGGARLLRFFDQPELVIATDIHEAEVMIEGNGPTEFKPGDGASFAEKASHNRGEITPPHLYELQRRLANELAFEGIRLRENVNGYISRTEGVNAMLRTPNVALLGFLGKNRHFEQGASTANIKDLVDLAKATVCYTLLTETPVWKEVMQS
jgi:putative aminopeptidase FrvX